MRERGLTPSALTPFATVPYSAGDATYTAFAGAPPDLRAFCREAVERHGDAIVVVYGEERLPLGELWSLAERAARAMLRQGIAPGDRVGIAMRNYPEWMIAYLATISIGAVAVCLNSWWTAEELAFGVADSGARLLFIDEERLERAAGLGVSLVAVRCDPGGRAHGWAEFIAVQAGSVPWPAIAPEQPATILYTSGSTARPKGVVSSHRAIIHAVMGYEMGAVALAERLKERNGGVAPVPAFPPALLLTAPLFHVTAMNSQFLLSLRLGRKIVCMRKWDAGEALALIERERVTQFSGVPTMVSELVNSPAFSSHDLSSLEAITGGGAAMTALHTRQVADRSGGRIAARTGYGMTETNGLAATNGGRALEERPGSVGRALKPLVSIGIVDPTGAPCPPMVEGEVLIHGVMNFTCYWNDPEATARTIREGWVHSGDLGYLDCEGFLYLTGRLKDFVNRGGEKVNCQEVEAAILAHDAIHDAVVFALPDERLGEVVACVCEIRAGQALEAQQLTEFLGDRLARFKLPERIWLQHQPLPRLASGKVDRRAAKAQNSVKHGQGGGI